MAINPSALNPIYMFKQDEPIWWNQNFYGPDRDDFYRLLPLQAGWNFYYQTSNGALAALVLRCSDKAEIGVVNPAGINITGDYYRTEINNFIGTTNEKYFLQLTPNVFEPKVVSTYEGSFVPCNSTKGSGAEFTIPSSISLNTVNVKIRVSVALNQNIQAHHYKIEPDNGNKFTHLGVTTVGAPVGTTIVSVSIPSTAKSPWGKNDRYGIIFFASHPADNFDLAYALNNSQIGIIKNNPVSLIEMQNAVNGVPTVNSFIHRHYHISPYIELIGTEVLYSELFMYKDYATPSIQGQTILSYSNKRLFQGLQPNTTINNPMPITFWQTKNPQQFEDIEILPGEFTRLRNELNTEVMFETDYLPIYLHKQLQLAFAMDSIIINGIEYIQRSEYTYDFPNRHYALSKGKVTLTERKSIVRNVI